MDALADPSFPAPGHAVYEAWVVFQLNEMPIRTERDGDFNCVALMDAASCFILANVFAAVGEAELSKMAVRRLLNDARAHKQRLLMFIGEARESFKERFGGGGVQ